MIIRMVDITFVCKIVRNVDIFGLHESQKVDTGLVYTGVKKRYT